MPVTLAVGQKTHTVSIRHHEEVRLESLITHNGQSDNNHNHMT